MTSIQTRILGLVSNGIRYTDLIFKLESEFTDDLIKLEKEINDLVKQGEIIEIEYTLPNMDYRIKHYYLPKGTRIEISK